MQAGSRGQPRSEGLPALGLWGYSICFKETLLYWNFVIRNHPSNPLDLKMRLDFWRKEERVEKKEAAMFSRFSPKRGDQKKVHIGG